MANPLSIDQLRKWGRSLWGAPQLPLPTPYQTQGSTGTATWGGYIQNKDASSQWHGRQRWILSSELAVNASVVAAGVHYFLNLISNPKWTAQPSDPSSEAKDMADFVNDVLANTHTPWPNIVRQAGMFRFHGFSVQEWTAEHRSIDGLIGISDIEVRPQHTIEQWAVDEVGHVLGCFQRNPQNNALLGLPRSKLVYMKEDNLTDSPEGLGVFRHLVEPYSRLRRFLELEVRAYERDLRGIPVGRAPLSAINQAVKAGNMTAEEGARLIQGMVDMVQTQVKQSDTGLLLDSQTFTTITAGGPVVSSEKQWSLDLLSGPALGLSEISAAIDRIQREMARIMGIEHLMLGGGTAGGAKAVASDKSQNVYLIANSVLRTIVASMQHDIIGPLWALNGFDDRLRPRLVAENIAPKDVVEVATTLARLSQSGATLAPDDPVVNDVRDMLGVSRTKFQPEQEVLTADPNDPNQPPAPLPKVLPPADGVNPHTPGTGEVDAQGKPKQSPEMQRLPRNTAASE
jgi:hypothetical protein